MPDRTTPPVAPADHLAFFRSHPPFEELGEAALACVVRAAEITYLPRGERVLTQGGAPSRFTYLIRKGAVRLQRDGQTVMVLEDGDLFGFPSYTSGDAPSFDVITDEDTLAYRIDLRRCDDLLHDSAWTGFLLEKLQQRLRRSAVPGAGSDAGMAEPLRGLIGRPPVWVRPGDTVREAAAIMRDRGISSVLVEGEGPGIVTDRDLRGRVLAEGLPPDTTVEAVASRPLLTLPDSAPLHEAVAFMLRHQVHHLPVTGDGAITGVVSNGDLLRHRSQSPLHLGRRIGRLESTDAVEGYAEDVADLVARLHDQGLDALRIARLLAGLNDTLVRSALRLAEDELGPPPAPYAWLVFGSEGRMEQTLLTDQDNALVWGGAAGDSPEAYFAALAEHVVNTLLQAGFPRCKGGYMATRWHMPLPRWQARFRRWIALEEPDALLDAANFFDFRSVHGRLDLEPLHSALHDAADDRIFLAHLAAQATRLRPPLGLFGRLKDHDGRVDLKKYGLLPIVGLARVHALAARSGARATPDRLDAAAEARALSPDDAATLTEAFAFLLRLRLRTQLEARERDEPLSNAVHLDRLSTLERRHLKEAFVVIRDAQDALRSRYHAESLA